MATAPIRAVSCPDSANSVLTNLEASNALVVRLKGILGLGSTTPAYSIAPSTTSVNEGGTVTFSVTTANVVNNTTLYYTIAGTNITAGDFTDNTLTGTVTINAVGTATFNKNIANDVTTEGLENFIVSLRTGSTTGQIVASSPAVSIGDTSLAAAGINTAPLFSNGGNTVTAPSTTAYVRLNDNITVTDAELLSSGNYNGAVLTVVRSSGAVVGDDFSTAVGSGVTFVNNNVKINNTTVGTYVKTSSTITITFNTLATQANVNTVLQNLTAKPSPTNAQLSFTWSFNDNNTGSAQGSGGALTSFTTTIVNYAAGVAFGSRYCTGNNLMSMYSNGSGGSYEGVFETNSATCGFVATTYAVTANMYSVAEGSDVVITVNTTNVANGTVLYYDTTGSVTNSNFTSGSKSGTVTINNNTGTFTKNIATVLAVGSSASFGLNIKTGSTSGPTVASLPQVVVINSSGVLQPSYSITSNRYTVNEGQTFAVYISTTDVAPGTQLFWTASGQTTDADFTTIPNGSFTLDANGQASLSVTVANDVLTEGTESFNVALTTDSGFNNIVASTSTISINDTSLTPVVSYNLVSNSGVVNEGDTLTLTANTVNVPNGTTLYYSIEGTNGSNITAADFVDGVLTGTVTINNNTGTFNKVISNDAVTEGTETLTVSLRTGSSAGPVKATTNISINDTSGTVVTYSLNSNKTSLNEGEFATFTMSTSNVANGTTLYWKNTNSATTTGVDLSINSGTFTINANTGTFNVTAVADLLTEGSETFTIEVHSGSLTGPVVGNTVNVTINDTSLTPVPTYSVSPSKYTLNEGETLIVNVGTTNVPASTTLYWTIESSAVNATDFTTPLNGTVTVDAAGTGSFSITTASDGVTEGNESFTIALRTTNSSGIVKATTSTITIQDSSTTPYTPGNLVDLGFDAYNQHLFAIQTGPIAVTYSLRIRQTGNEVQLGQLFGEPLMNGTISANSSKTFTVPAPNDGDTYDVVLSAAGYLNTNLSITIPVNNLTFNFTSPYLGFYAPLSFAIVSGNIVVTVPPEHVSSFMMRLDVIDGNAVIDPFGQTSVYSTSVPINNSYTFAIRTGHNASVLRLASHSQFGGYDLNGVWYNNVSYFINLPAG